MFHCPTPGLNIHKQCASVFGYTIIPTRYWFSTKLEVFCAFTVETPRGFSGQKASSQPLTKKMTPRRLSLAAQLCVHHSFLIQSTAMYQWHHSRVSPTLMRRLRLGTFNILKL